MGPTAGFLELSLSVLSARDLILYDPPGEGAEGPKISRAQTCVSDP